MVASAIELESPASPDELYQVLGDDVTVLEHRPLLTGDVLSLQDGRMVTLLQHPCSMRRGIDLVPRLQVAPVELWESRAPSDWTKHVLRMFLPKFSEAGDHAIEFDKIDLVESSDALEADRLAVLSQRGVNLLLQRYIHHVSRVIVPTISINEMISGQFDEADLTGDAIEELVRVGFAIRASHERVDKWLGEGARGATRREQLDSPQHRSVVRRDLRAQVRAWSAEDPQPELSTGEGAK